MARIEWDQLKDRNFETGIDRGVLYLEDGKGVVWNGLTSVEQNFSGNLTTPVFFDGRKINDFIVTGEFSGTIKAFTYPDEFLDYEGIFEIENGLFIDNQKPKQFSIAFRSQEGDGIDGIDAGYKIHILFNLIATPSDKDFNTLGDNASAMTFQWAVNSVPEAIEGYNPTSYLLIESKCMDPWLLEDIEALIYGNNENDAILPSYEEFTEFLLGWARLKIIDNGDGTWTAIDIRDNYITMLTEDQFEIDAYNAEYIDEDTYILGSTTDFSPCKAITIIDNGDETWTAIGPDELITLIEDGVIQIDEAQAIYLDENTYDIESTS